MKYIFRTTVVMAVAIFLNACKKEWNELGSELVVSNNLELLLVDDQEIQISVVKEDSLITLNRPTSFIGSTSDPYFGSTNASLYTEFRLPSSGVEFGASAQVDSIFLFLEISGYYGDTLCALNISAREMIESIETTIIDSADVESSVTIYSTDDFDFHQEVIGNIEQIFQPNSNPQLKLTLSNDFGQHFLDADPANFENNETFQDFFSGLYITASKNTENGLLLELDLLNELSKITMYYSNDQADSLSYDFQINSSADRMTRWSHDYSVSEIEEALNMEYTTQGYVQGGVGLRTYIELPNLNSLKESNYVFHSAELIIPYISNELDSIFYSPDKLGLAAVNNEGNLEVLNEDQNIMGSAYFDGNRNDLSKTFTFNISRYIHKVIQEGYTNRLALYVPSSVSQPERVIINNHAIDSTGLQLKMLVSYY